MSDVDEKALLTEIYRALSSFEIGLTKEEQEHFESVVRNAVNPRTQSEAKAEVWLTLDEYDALLRKASRLNPISQPEAAKGEKCIRYCFMCSSIGEPPETALNCCPEHRECYVPLEVAEQAKRGFDANPHTEALRVVAQDMLDVMDNFNDLTDSSFLNEEQAAANNDVIERLREALTAIAKPEG